MDDESLTTPFTPSHQDQVSSHVSDQELQSVIADFLAMGHVENIVAMFKQEDRYYDWIDTLLQDERFAVRLGTTVLFEYLMEECQHKISLAIPALKRALADSHSWVRGEAVNILDLLNLPEIHELLQPLADDPDPQVREIVADILGGTDDA